MKGDSQGSMLERMIELAKIGYAGKVDKAGEPIIDHAMRSCGNLPSDADEEQKCIVVGHDLVEENPDFVTEETLKAYGQSDRVIQGIKDATRWPGQSLNDYQRQVMSNVDSMVAKRADLEDNMDESRLNEITEKDERRLQVYRSFAKRIDRKLKRIAPQSVRVFG